MMDFLLNFGGLLLAIACAVIAAAFIYRAERRRRFVAMIDRLEPTQLRGQAINPERAARMTKSERRIWKKTQRIVREINARKGNS